MANLELRTFKILRIVYNNSTYYLCICHLFANHQHSSYDLTIYGVHVSWKHSLIPPDKLTWVSHHDITTIRSTMTHAYSHHWSRLSRLAISYKDTTVYCILYILLNILYIVNKTYQMQSNCYLWWLYASVSVL